MKKRWTQAATLAVLSIVFLVVVAGTRQPDSVMQHRGYRPECALDTLTHDYLLPGPITRIPEFHDCQRFIIGRERHGTYRGLYGLFVRQHAGSVTFGTIQPTGHCDSAMTVNAAGQPTCLAGGTTTIGTAVPMAIIQTPDGTYGPLGITPGFSCLYLFQDPGSSPPTFRAKMHHAAMETGCYANVNEATLTGTPLRVRFVSVPGFGSEHYPEVGRWDRDDQGHYFIDMRCGPSAGYCEVGAMAGWGPSPTFNVTVGTPKERRVWNIKLWYDEQFLAVPSAGGGVRPSMIRGFTVPDPDLDQRVEANYTAPGVTWLPGSKVLVVGGAYNKLNLEPGVMPSTDGMPTVLNTVDICYGPMSKCIPPELQASMTSCPSSGDSYWERWTPPSGHAHYHCAKYMVHPGVRIAGTSRWHWLKNDETQWMKCPSGCCTPQ